MRDKRTLVLGAIGVVILFVAAVLVGRATVGDDGENASQIVVPSPVERRTLTDSLIVDGELRRNELQTINSAIDGRVSEVSVADGDTVELGRTLFSLEGRAAVAVEGDFAFFRQLDVGSDGPDVLQLEEILSAGGYDVGRVDELFTEQTRQGLAAWQVSKGYGGFTPEPDETVTVSLSSGTGYEIGPRNAASVVIGPSVPAGGVEPSAATTAQRARLGPVRPVITVAVSPAAVDEGQSLRFRFSADPAPTTDLTIDLTIGGDATGGEDGDDADYREIDDSFVFPSGRKTFDLTVPTFVDDEVEEDEEIEVELSQQFNDDGFYRVGPIRSATGVIRANGEERTPRLTVSTATDLAAEGDSVDFTIEADEERNEDYDIAFALEGSLAPGADFVVPDDELTMTAGSTEVSVTVDVRNENVVEFDEALTFRLLSGPDYLVGTPNAATVVVEDDDVPELSLVGGATVGEGGATAFTIQADQPFVEATSVSYSVAGSAQPGEDFEVLTGTVVMGAGQRSATVPIRTLDDDVVFLPSDMIVADWPAQVGSVDVDDGEFILQGSPVLTLTEPEFTINLAVSASDRAELEVGQAVLVDIAAEDSELEGVISELDDTATVDEAGNETYEGVVNVESQVAAVDGASASIEVVLDERVDVLVVPVAAVLQQGGEQQVRTIADDGTIERVTVETGLVDDEFIEIVSGLADDAVVVVSVDDAPNAE